MTDQDDSQERLPVIPEDEVTQQRIISFMSDDLAAALTRNGEIYVHLNAMIAALGLNTRGQTQRIQRTPTLARGLRRIPLETTGGTQKVLCLRVDKVALWLAGIETNRVKAAYREKIEHYQEELAPIAMKIFTHVMGLPSPTTTVADPRLASLAEQYDLILDVALFMREHMQALAALPEQIARIALTLDDAVAMLESLTIRQEATEVTVAHIEAKTAHLTPAQARAVQERVTQIIEATRNAAYPLSYPIVYGRLKSRFRVASYAQISETHFDAVMRFLDEELQRSLDGKPAQGSLF